MKKLTPHVSTISRHLGQPLLTSVALLAAACSFESPPNHEPTETVAASKLAQQPAIGSSHSQDLADHDCRIILRTLHRATGPTGYDVEVIDGRAWFVWEGEIEVASELASRVSNVSMLYTSSMTEQWWQSPAAKIVDDDDDDGFVTFRVRLAEHTVPTGASMTSLMRSKLQVVPVARLDNGTRLFDHNRQPGDFDNYDLDSTNSWSVASDDTCSARVSKQPMVATVEFEDDWAEIQHGDLVQGGRLRVSYELSRLPDCRATHNGFPAWQLRGFAKFFPGGQTYEGSLRAFENHNGSPTNHAYSVPWEITIPSDAQRVELWFLNESGAGNSCERWDSNYGNNYSFQVRESSPAEVQWAGDWGNSTSRSGLRTEGVEDPMTIDSYRRQRAVLFVEADAYAPGVTDATSERWPAMMAEVQWETDTGLGGSEWLELQGRVGNNLRYRWDLPLTGDLDHEPWKTISYVFRFSTDGTHWYVAQRPDGTPRVIERAY